MKGVNKVIIVGTCLSDPELRETKNGPVANLNIVTNDEYTDKNTGEKVKKTEYHKCVAFGRLVDSFISKYVTKGSKIYIEGSLQTSSYDKTYKDCGVVHKVYSTQVIIRDLQQVGSGVAKEEPAPTTFKQHQKTPEIVDDDIPF
jgi:single-strand DNA-binding protein